MALQLMRGGDENRKRYEPCDNGLLMCAQSLQSCLTLCDPVDCSLPGSSFHRFLQAKNLEYVALPSSRGSS